MLTIKIGRRIRREEGKSSVRVQRCKSSTGPSYHDVVKQERPQLHLCIFSIRTGGSPVVYPYRYRLHHHVLGNGDALALIIGVQQLSGGNILSRWSLRNVLYISFVRVVFVSVVFLFHTENKGNEGENSRQPPLCFRVCNAATRARRTRPKGR